MDGKLDLRIQKTYMALSNALIDLMQEKRFEEITVNELCTRSLIGRGTFYKHFADKYEFLAFVIREQYQDFCNRIPNCESSSSFEDDIKNILSTCLNFLEQSPAVIAALEHDHGSAIFENAISDVAVPDLVKKLREMETNGYPLPFDAVSMAQLTVTITNQIIMWWIKNRESVSKDVFLQFLCKNTSSLLTPITEKTNCRQK